MRDRLHEPQDGGLWSSGKVAAWMAEELGLVSVAAQRGWGALKAIGWSIQKPRPKNPKSATAEEAAAFKRMARPVCKQFCRERRLIGLRQRIRPRGEPPAKMEIRAFRSS
ncbi:helix-turn-helix domain-containing protein [Methylocapsa palsarum]|uniref:helix-turn-helix domain-containing protein n=1 Tax=Methylocapsa palsarum TaxID=1612308 RepID=UPI000B814A61